MTSVAEPMKQPVSHPVTPVADEDPALINEELAARNPAFAAALAAGMKEQRYEQILAQIYEDVEDNEFELAVLDDLVEGCE